jgi:hypothetical protein
MTGYGGSLDYDGQKVLENQTDGLEYNANVNYGFKLKDNGFLMSPAIISIKQKHIVLTTNQYFLITIVRNLVTVLIRMPVFFLIIN